MTSRHRAQAHELLLEDLRYDRRNAVIAVEVAQTGLDE